jgi:hypothetical protein
LPAASAGSTAGKVLARLAGLGEIRRTEGGHEGGRRLPDRFSLAPAEHAAAGAKPPAADAAPPTTAEDMNADAASPTTAEDAKAETAEDPEPRVAADARPDLAADALRPGQLDGLVLAFLKENADSGPHGPTAVAKALGRSSEFSLAEKSARSARRFRPRGPMLRRSPVPEVARSRRVGVGASAQRLDRQAGTP